MLLLIEEIQVVQNTQSILLHSSIKNHLFNFYYLVATMKRWNCLLCNKFIKSLKINFALVRKMIY